jgi:dTDP-4-amino-4,6-dideoxygalactose transaminase
MEPGILSGVPAFPRPVLHVQPTLPDLEEIAEPLRAMLDSRWLTNHGPYVCRLEERLEEYLQVHCVCVSSGTMALYLAASCLLGPRARVLVPAYTFPATAQAFVMRGARVVLADVDEGSWCLDPDALRPGVLGEVDCLVPVNVYGTPPCVEELDARAAASGCLVIYDSAHGLGSERRGRKVGGFGQAEAFSLHATKLVACGEGGLIATRDEELAREVRLRLNFGLDGRVVRSPGTNGKMQELSAILGLWGMDRLESWIGHRARLAALYRERLRGVPGLGFQQTEPGDRPNHVNFAVRVGGEFGLDRDSLLRALAADNVFGRAMLAPDLSAHPGLSDAVSVRAGRRLRNAEGIAGSVLCLPISSHQEEDEVSRICDCLCRIQEAAGRIRAKLGATAGEVR